jgi:hypothetical protein
MPSYLVFVQNEEGRLCKKKKKGVAEAAYEWTDV